MATVLLMLTALPLQAQDHVFKTLDELGWTTTNFTIPDHLTELDTGYVNYQVNLSRKGKVTRIRILQNSFTEATEKLWRQSMMKCAFTRTDATKPAAYKGTFYIARAYCSSEGTASDEQIDLFPRTP